MSKPNQPDSRPEPLNDISALFLAPDSTIEQAMSLMDSTGYGIALIVDGQRRLIGTIVDGDIRRAMLANADAQRPVTDLLAHKAPIQAMPITAPMHIDTESLEALRQLHSLRHVPILDDSGRVVDLYAPEPPLPAKAVVMAGGFGKRLRPLTDELPKPMLPVGGRPLIALIVEQLRAVGIQDIAMTTHYKPEKIMGYFGDGAAFDVRIRYISEEKPLGTAGGVGLLDTPDLPLLVVNGDILTRVNYRDMLAYHQETGAALTLAVRKADFTVPYGVVETEGGLVRRLVEKPTYSYIVNAGIYLLSPEAHRLIPKGQRMDMTDLITLLIGQGKRVASFFIREYWLDIGHYDDYVRAQRDIEGWSIGEGGGR